MKINTEKPAALGKNLNRGRGNAATKGIVEKDGSIVESPVAIDFEAEASSQDVRVVQFLIPTNTSSSGSRFFSNRTLRKESWKPKLRCERPLLQLLQACLTSAHVFPGLWSTFLPANLLSRGRTDGGTTVRIVLCLYHIPTIILSSYPALQAHGASVRDAGVNNRRIMTIASFASGGNYNIALLP